MSELRSLPSLRVSGCKRAQCLLIALACAVVGRADPVAADAQSPAADVKVNRTLPKVSPPQTGFAFPPDPTPQDFFRARVFEEPLVPIGGEPTPAENGALATALLQYSQRTSADDFVSVTGFLTQHPRSAWRAALLTSLGLEYYKAAYYACALEAWQEAWALGQKATDARGKFLADRAVCELAGLYSRLGRMNELEALLKSIEKRVFLGGASERINLAREALSMMQHQPGISFRCGPLALHRILLSDESLLTLCSSNAMMEIFNSASTQQGFSLPQVAELSQTVGLNYQMAFRESDGDFVIPSVVHWKVGHYAALIRQVGDRYLLEDPTFGNTVWATKQALEAETSGYFLIPPGELPHGWRRVDATEGGVVWGKGVTSGLDPDIYTEDDMQTGEVCERGNKYELGNEYNVFGMAVSRVHLMLANLHISDTPVGYTPPVGPAIRFTLHYNHRDYILPPNINSTVFGPKWSHNWNASIRDNPASPFADVKYYVGGGGVRTFTGFNSGTQTFASQQYGQALLKRTGTNSYEMTFPDGSRKIFGLRSANQVFLTQVVDPAGNAVTLNWEDFSIGDLSVTRLTNIVDAIGQNTTISYTASSTVTTNVTGNVSNIVYSQYCLIDRVTDPFGRFATFNYRNFDVLIQDRPAPNPDIYMTVRELTKITDVLGLESRFGYLNDNDSNATNETDIIERLITPYGTNTFVMGQGGGPSGTTRFLETHYPDGTRDRVEFNQNTNGIAFSDPPGLVPQGVNVFNQYLYGRNTFYWSRNACAQGYGDHSKAKIYHWLHTANVATTAGILESTKEPLERRVWNNYPGQNIAPFHTVGSSDRPTRVGRVLDDGYTQLYTFAYNSFGHVTNSIDPIGRELSYLYSTNGIDLLEVRQTRAANNELLTSATYNNQHRPLTVTDAAGQTTTNTYSARGQLLTTTNPKGETTSFTYNANGYLIMVDGPLPGTNDVFTATYDGFGRLRTMTDESGYTLTFDYDVMDRLTRVTYPDATYSQFTYDRLDLVAVRDSATRQTFFEYDNMRQITKRTDPLGRVTRFQWCSCGGLGSLIDPMGRTTEWHTDVQGRRISKQYGDGSMVRYFYENATSRLRQVIDEKQQVAYYGYNRDNTLRSIGYASTSVPTPGVSYTYDPDYERVVSMNDGTGTTLFAYLPITASPALGAGAMASMDGPLPNDTITYGYDELGRRVSTAINGVAALMTYDEAGRVVGETNALGSFTYGYEGSSDRLASQSFPTGQTGEISYGNNLQDRTLQRITHKVGATAVSEFLYGRDVPAGRITTWSQQAGALPPDFHTFGYDAVNQLLSATVTNGGTLITTFAYAHDPAGNRLTEQVGASNYNATYNALNQISTSSAPGASRTNEWDAEDRLVAVNTSNQRTEFTYDGFSRLASLRLLTNGVQASLRRFVWCGRDICEERDASGVVAKRFFDQGMKVETGPATGSYYYTRDHLGSIREVTDAGGSVRARYAYDPYGRQSRLTGDREADFGYAGMFWSSEAGLSLTHYRAYDPELGRWLSRDPLEDAEMKEGPNLYAYVANDPVNLIDPDGLASTLKTCLTPVNAAACAAAGITVAKTIQTVAPAAQRLAPAANALACRGGDFAGLMNSVSPFANTISAAAPAVTRMAQTLPSIAPSVSRVVQQTPDWLLQMAPQIERTGWFVRTLNEYRSYWENLSPEDAYKFLQYMEWLKNNL